MFGQDTSGDYRKPMFWGARGRRAVCGIGPERVQAMVAQYHAWVKRSRVLDRTKSVALMKSQRWRRAREG